MRFEIIVLIIILQTFFYRFILLKEMAENFGKSKTQGERRRIQDRGEIIGLWKSGKTIYQVANELGIKYDTAKRWIDR